VITGRGFTRSGFVLPLALFMIMLVALFVALLLEGALQELRAARGEVAEARARAAAESGLSDLLSSVPDSALLARPRGASSGGLVAAGTETTRVSMQSLGNGVLRATATARSWSGGVRGDAATVGFVRIVADPAAPPGGLRFRRLPRWWWAQLP
jgi:hypothetical protein